MQKFTMKVIVTYGGISTTETIGFERGNAIKAKEQGRRTWAKNAETCEEYLQRVCDTRNRKNTKIRVELYQRSVITPMKALAYLEGTLTNPPQMWRKPGPGEMKT